jgi:hypothetical protein
MFSNNFKPLDTYPTGVKNGKRGDKDRLRQVLCADLHKSKLYNFKTLPDGPNTLQTVSLHARPSSELYPLYALRARMSTEGNHKKRKIRFMHYTSLPPRKGMRLGMLREISEPCGKVVDARIYPLSAELTFEPSNWTACSIARRLFWKSSALRETTPTSNSAEQPVDLRIANGRAYYDHCTIARRLFKEGTSSAGDYSEKQQCKATSRLKRLLKILKTE